MNQGDSNIGDTLNGFKVVLVHIDRQPLPPWVPERFADEDIAFVYEECEGPDDVVRAAGDAQVVWTFGSGGWALWPECLPQLPACRVILRSGSGTDNIPVEEATRLGIVVANTPEVTTDAVAEHTIGLFLSVSRCIARADQNVRSGTWDRKLVWPISHLTGATLGIVGFGRIGRGVARVASGFRMRILAYDPVVDAADMETRGVRAVELDDLLETADFVSLHCPLMDQTRHLIGRDQFRRMKRTAVFVNAARGAIVDEGALVHALQEKWIAGAGLDVLEHTPVDPGSPLLIMENVVITPHIAGESDESPDIFWRHSVRTAVEVAKGRMPLWYVNPQVKLRWDPQP